MSLSGEGVGRMPRRCAATPTISFNAFMVRNLNKQFINKLFRSSVSVYFDFDSRKGIAKSSDTVWEFFI